MINVTVKATLVSNVPFRRLDGELITLPLGTELAVDPENNLGYLDGDCFDLYSNEYQIRYLN